MSYLLYQKVLMTGGLAPPLTAPFRVIVYHGDTQHPLGQYMSEATACRDIIRYFADIGICSHEQIKTNLEYSMTGTITHRYDKDRTRRDMGFIVNRRMLKVFYKEYGGVTYRDGLWGFVFCASGAAPDASGSSEHSANVPPASLDIRRREK